MPGYPVNAKASLTNGKLVNANMGHISAIGMHVTSHLSLERHHVNDISPQNDTNTHINPI